MARQREFSIKESTEELESYKPKVSGYKSSQRLNALILIKTKKGKTLLSTAEQFGVHSRTLDRWIKRYNKEGIGKYLSKEKRSKQSKIIAPEIHKELEEKLHSSVNPFSGYVEVQEWLLKEHGVDIEYQWLWKYMKTKLNSVLKVPRKSNIKKEEGAEASFFKTAQQTGTN